ncbi:MAG: amino acid permease, partial [Myxococcales bacterium]|nr:amino acid permease [Myxococcales bacterium]
MGEDTNLERSLGLGSLTASGVGVMIGAGIYVLIGEIIGLVGGGAWLAFVAAALAALPTGLAYAELASRYPRAAGEAVFVDRAFGRPLLTFIVGFVVLSSGVTSVAAVSHGFAAYLGDLIGDPLGLGALAAPLAIVLFLVALSALNHRGIAASTRLNTICTVASVAGLVILIAAGIPRWGSVDLWTIGAVADGTGAGVEQGSLAVILGGAALAFYAFVGFEDLCNVAEEVQAPSRTIPRAILLSMAIAAVVYVGVAITAVSAVPAAELASSPVPLVRVWERLLPGLSSAWLALVALFATTNTALVNLIMGSRVLFGMGRDGWIPALFARVDRRRATPTV